MLKKTRMMTSLNSPDFYGVTITAADADAASITADSVSCSST
jgi:hypothetical protein